jgi:hypothetical protein
MGERTALVKLGRDVSYAVLNPEAADSAICGYRPVIETGSDGEAPS